MGGPEDLSLALWEERECFGASETKAWALWGNGARGLGVQCGKGNCEQLLTLFL